jgi:hypothetical protein
MTVRAYRETGKHMGHVHQNDKILRPIDLSQSGSCRNAYRTLLPVCKPKKNDTPTPESHEWSGSGREGKADEPGAVSRDDAEEAPEAPPPGLDDLV